MDPSFRDLHRHLQTAASHLQAAALHQRQAVDAIVTTTDALIAASGAAAQAHDEQEDLRVTVHRLEGLVMKQTEEIQQLRERLNGGGA